MNSLVDESLHVLMDILGNSSTMHALFNACKAFIDSINPDPERVIVRLWPKFVLDPDFERLLVSN